MSRSGIASLLIATSAALVVLAILGAFVEYRGIAPRLFALYLEHRVGGHDPFIEQVGRRLSRVLLSLDRAGGIHGARNPTWIGARTGGERPASVAAADARRVIVASEAEALRALARAQPGDVIEFAPGVYRFQGRRIGIDRPGESLRPIVVRSPALGTVTLEFDLLEGFHVTAPHWVFENLVIRGVCVQDDHCEHAFHIVGAARGVIVRNNVISDFNAQIKINGAAGRFPDGGRLEHNTLFNHAARLTANPVTPVDLVAASDWTIERNFIADFVKRGGDGTSYGAFAKGGGTGNRFVANAVVCEHRLQGVAGRRVGLSFGGGGSAPQGCRDGRCAVEQVAGLMQSNLVASCSDVGIYVNRSAQTKLIHNTVLDTAGVEVRFAGSSVTAQRNLVDGGMIARDGALLEGADNRSSLVSLSFLGLHPVRSLFVDAADLDLRWRGAPPQVNAPAVAPIADLCGGWRDPPMAYGAFDDFASCLRRASPAERR